MFKEGKMFVPVRSEEPKTPKEYLMQEVSEDIALFSPKSQKIIRKIERGEKLNPEEQKTFSSERSYWWKDKYGFPFDESRKDPNNKSKVIIAREEVLMRKYATPEELKEAISLQNDLFKAVQSDNEEEIGKIKARYLEKYPGQLEGIEIILGIKDFIKKSLFIDSVHGKQLSREEKEFKLKTFREITEYQFLITHFLINSGGDTDSKEYLGNFWKATEKIAGDADPKGEYLKRMQILRRGIVGQVASYKLFERLGFDPKLSHPEEDAFQSIDMWTEENDAVQVKSTYQNTPELLKTDYVSYPAITMKTQDQEIHVNEKYAKTYSQLKRSLSEISREKHKKMRGYVMVIPNSMIDFVTGEPDPELEDFFRKKMSEKQEIAA